MTRDPVWFCLSWMVQCAKKKELTTYFLKNLKLKWYGRFIYLPTYMSVAYSLRAHCHMCCVCYITSTSVLYLLKLRVLWCQCYYIPLPFPPLDCINWMSIIITTSEANHFMKRVWLVKWLWVQCDSVWVRLLECANKENLFSLFCTINRNKYIVKIQET